MVIIKGADPEKLNVPSSFLIYRPFIFQPSFILLLFKDNLFIFFVSLFPTYIFLLL